jgi:hypothetical protein
MSTPKTSKFTLKRIVENLGKIPDKGFGEETPTLTPEQKKRLMEMASMFENYGHAIHNEEAIVNSAKAMTELCELAEAYALNECGDWFQQDIVKKDMKELKKRVMEYNKVAKEAYSRMQQLGVSYQDIGHVLGRYYDLKKTPPQGSGPVNGKKQALQNEGEEVCAWCGKHIADKSGVPGKSHGICDTCRKDWESGRTQDQATTPSPSTH